MSKSFLAMTLSEPDDHDRPEGPRGNSHVRQGVVSRPSSWRAPKVRQNLSALRALLMVRTSFPTLTGGAISSRPFGPDGCSNQLCHLLQDVWLRIELDNERYSK
jgi:hypothetical protein